MQLIYAQNFILIEEVLTPPEKLRKKNNKAYTVGFKNNKTFYSQFFFEFVFRFSKLQSKMDFHKLDYDINVS